MINPKTMRELIDAELTKLRLNGLDMSSIKVRAAMIRLVEEAMRRAVAAHSNLTDSTFRCGNCDHCEPYCNECGDPLGRAIKEHIDRAVEAARADERELCLSVVKEYMRGGKMWDGTEGNEAAACIDRDIRSHGREGSK